MTLLGAIRPDEINLPLFLHVLGAMLLVGTLLAVAAATVLGWRRSDDAAGLARFGLLTLLLGVVPSYVLMRVGAQWTESEQSYPEELDPAWLGIGDLDPAPRGVPRRRLGDDGEAGLAAQVTVCYLAPQRSELSQTRRVSTCGSAPLHVSLIRSEAALFP